MLSDFEPGYILEETYALKEMLWTAEEPRRALWRAKTVTDDPFPTNAYVHIMLVEPVQGEDPTYPGSASAWLNWMGQLAQAKRERHHLQRIQVYPDSPTPFAAFLIPSAKSLAELISQDISPDQVSAVTSALATIVNNLHETGVALGSIAAENVFIDQDGTVTLCCENGIVPDDFDNYATQNGQDLIALMYRMLTNGQFDGADSVVDGIPYTGGQVVPPSQLRGGVGVDMDAIALTGTAIPGARVCYAIAQQLPADRILPYAGTVLAAMPTQVIDISDADVCVDDMPAQNQEPAENPDPAESTDPAKNNDPAQDPDPAQNPEEEQAAEPVPETPETGQQTPADGTAGEEQEPSQEMAEAQPPADSADGESFDQPQGIEDNAACENVTAGHDEAFYAEESRPEDGAPGDEADDGQPMPLPPTVDEVVSGAEAVEVLQADEPVAALEVGDEPIAIEAVAQPAWETAETPQDGVDGEESGNEAAGAHSAYEGEGKNEGQDESRDEGQDEGADSESSSLFDSVIFNEDEDDSSDPSTGDVQDSPGPMPMPPAFNPPTFDAVGFDNAQNNAVSTPYEDAAQMPVEAAPIQEFPQDIAPMQAQPLEAAPAQDQAPLAPAGAPEMSAKESKAAQKAARKLEKERRKAQKAAQKAADKQRKIAQKEHRSQGGRNKAKQKGQQQGSVLAPSPQTVSKLDVFFSPAKRYRNKTKDTVNPMPLLMGGIAVIMVLAFGLSMWGILAETPTAKRAAAKELQIEKREKKGKSSTKNAPTAPPEIVAVNSIDPEGDQNEHPEMVDDMIDGNDSTIWMSRYYSAPNFNGTKSGIGIAISLKEKAQVKAVTLKVLGEGGKAELRATSSDKPKEGKVLATSSFSSTTQFKLKKPVTTDSLVIWITELPKDDDGRYRIKVSELSVR